MSDDEVDREDRPGLVRRVADHLRPHHHDPELTGDAELAQDAEKVGFDLDTDVAHPAPGHNVASFDLDTDIGPDNEPPDLRR